MQSHAQNQATVVSSAVTQRREWGPGWLQNPAEQAAVVRLGEVSNTGPRDEIGVRGKKLGRPQTSSLLAFLFTLI